MNEKKVKVRVVQIPEEKARIFDIADPDGRPAKKSKKKESPTTKSEAKQE